MAQLPVGVPGQLPSPLIQWLGTGGTCWRIGACLQLNRLGDRLIGLGGHTHGEMVNWCGGAAGTHSPQVVALLDSLWSDPGVSLFGGWQAGQGCQRGTTFKIRLGEGSSQAIRNRVSVEVSKIWR